MVQKVVGSIPISHPTTMRLASVVQRLVCKFSKLEMRFRLPPLAPLILVMESQFGLEYRHVDRQNLEAALQIQRETWPDDVDYDDFADKVEHTRDDNCFFLIYDTGKLIGLVGVDVWRKQYPDTIWLDWFTILPQYRRRGYGTKVLQDTIAYCKTLKRFRSFRVETTTYEYADASLALYDKVIGFYEDYTAEDTAADQLRTRIYSLPLLGELEAWNNRPLGLREYYNRLEKK